MLKRRAFTAILWSGTDLAGRQGLQLFVALILARILTPGDFGVMAILLLFTSVANVIVDGGFSAALIQRQEVSQRDCSTVFWINVVLGVLLAITMVGGSEAIGRFYGLPELRWLSPAMAACIILSSLGAIHATLLAKRLDFKRLALVNAVSTAVAGGVALCAALAGLGVWALVVQSLVAASGTALGLWLASGWRPSLEFSNASMRSLAAFGGYNFCANVLEAAYNRFYTVLIGRGHSTQVLGFYANADMIRQVPGGFLSATLSRVMFPMLSAAAGDLERTRRGVQLALRGAILINAPLMLGLAALAEPFVLAVMGPQWGPAVPILRILCLAGLLYPLQSINLQILLAGGESRLMFRVEVVKKLLGVALIFVGAHWGVLGVAWSQVVFAVVALGINAYCAGRRVGLGPIQQLKETLPAIAAALAMAAPAWWVASRWNTNAWLELGAIVPLAALFYFGVVWLLRVDAAHDVAALLRRDVAST